MEKENNEEVERKQRKRQKVHVRNNPVGSDCGVGWMECLKQILSLIHICLSFFVF